MLQKPIIRCRNTYCEKCKKDTIDCFDINNRRMGYNNLISDLTEEEILKKFDITTLSYMMCTMCKDQFMINWMYGLPRPLRYDTVFTNT